MTSPALLETDGLTKHFGELYAVNAVDLAIREGETTAVIGPNGAGKTTLFNLVTRRMRADRGRVRFRGTDITTATPHAVARMGLVRTFQVSSVFPGLSVQQNLLTAVLAHTGRSGVSTRSLGRERESLERVQGLLVGLDLRDVANVACDELAYGTRRRVEVGMALALEPRLLLLDEPTAGMGTSERQATVELLSELARRGDTTLVLTEHDVDLVMSVAQRIVVMHQGEIIADGTPEEIVEDTEVRRAYLGESR